MVWPHLKYWTTQISGSQWVWMLIFQSSNSQPSKLVYSIPVEFMISGEEDHSLEKFMVQVWPGEKIQVGLFHLKLFSMPKLMLRPRVSSELHCSGNMVQTTRQRMSVWITDLQLPISHLCWLKNWTSQSTKALSSHYKYKKMFQLGSQTKRKHGMH